jgi:hypothetical protein
MVNGKPGGFQAFFHKRSDFNVIFNNEYPHGSFPMVAFWLSIIAPGWYIPAVIQA